MPLYDFQCAEGHKFEKFVALKDFEDPVFCGCNAPAQRLISAPMFSVDQVGYTCPVTGEWIGSKREHRENLAKHGCRVLETGEKEAAAARRAADDAKLDKLIEDRVEKEIESFTSDQKEQLHNELINGKLDLAYERSTAG